MQQTSQQLSQQQHNQQALRCEKTGAWVAKSTHRTLPKSPSHQSKQGFDPFAVEKTISLSGFH